MKDQSAIRLLLTFSIAVFSLLIFFSFIDTSFSLGSWQSRPVDFVSDAFQVKPVVSDSSLAVKPSSSDSVADPVVLQVPDYKTFAGIIGYGHPRGKPLVRFSNALRALQAGQRAKVRIGYFGDSYIEGDILTKDFREMLQMQYGGTGVGFVPVTSITSGFRPTIRHSFRNWEDRNFHSQNNRGQVFLSGHSFTDRGGASVSYGTVKDSLLSLFQEVYLLYDGSVQTEALINGVKVSLPANGVFSRQLVAKEAREVKASPLGNATWYGFSFEADTGIVVDNFSFRGISGIEYRYLDSAWLKEISHKQPYDLIILQFGPNLLYKPNSVNFSYYEKPMMEAIRKLKEAFPEADLLLISSGDKAFKYNGQYQTAKGLFPLLETQQRIAQNSEVNFWNLYMAMGAAGSMIKWVEGDTAYANRDYTHVNWKGGKKIATLLYKEIEKAFIQQQK